MSPDQRQQVAGLFDRTAETYDNVGVDLFQPVAQLLLAELAPQPGERGLDIGCGRGAVLFPLARALGPAGRAVGIDLAPRMVEGVRADAADLGLDVDVRVDDAQEPALDEGPFDLIASSLVLFFLPDPLAALRAWRTRLVPGGRLGISSFGGHSPEWHVVDEVFRPYLPKGMADPRTQPKDSPFASDEGVEGLFGSAGLTEIRTVTAVLPVRFADKDQWHRWTWSVGQRRMWEAVPEEERPAVRSAAYARLDQCRDDQGRIGFDQGLRFTVGRG